MHNRRKGYNVEKESERKIMYGVTTGISTCAISTDKTKIGLL